MCKIYNIGLIKKIKVFIFAVIIIVLPTLLGGCSYQNNRVSYKIEFLLSGYGMMICGS